VIPGRGRGDQDRARRLAGGMDAEAHFQRIADDALSGDLDLYHNGRRRQHGDHSRCRQPRDQLAPFWKCTQPLTYLGWARPLNSATASDSPWARSSRAPRSCASMFGRCRHRFHRDGFRDLRARAHSDSLDSLQQLLHGDGNAGDGVSGRKYRTTEISATTPPWRAPLAAMASASPTRRRSFPRSVAQSSRRHNGVPALLEFITCRELAASRMNKSFYMPALPEPV